MLCVPGNQIRTRAFGCVIKNTVILTCYRHRNETIRLISARNAEKGEAKRYERQ
jgi:uncharacterized DUF497 family protein